MNDARDGAATREAARKPTVEVVRATGAHDEALAAFYRAVWDRDATADSVRRARAAAAAANPVTPGEEPPTFLFLSDGAVLGHVTTIPIRVWNGAVERPAHWLNGLMVLPEHRNGPIGFYVLKEAARQLGCLMALTVQQAPQRLFQALGFANLGTLPNFLRVLRPAAVLRRLDVAAVGLSGLPRWAPRALRLAQRTGLATLAGAGAAVALRLWVAARGRAARSLAVEPLAPGAQPPALDEAWRLARQEIAGTSVRDARYVPWRYDTSEGGPYRQVVAREGGATVGFAVVRRPRAEGDPRLSGIRVATVSEIVFPPGRPAVGLAVLAGAERAARALGADALLCSASHPALLALLPRRAYVRVPGNLHFLYRDPGNALALPSALADWWLTRGDMNADEVF